MNSGLGVNLRAVDSFNGKNGKQNKIRKLLLKYRRPIMEYYYPGHARHRTNHACYLLLPNYT